VKAGEPLGSESFGPLADVPHAQAAEAGGFLQGLTPIEKEQDTAAACQPGRTSRRALPTLDLSTFFRGQADRQGGLAAPHGDTDVSRCVKKARSPTDRNIRQDQRKLSIRYPFSAALY
jgi:hypothetical protein